MGSTIWCSVGFPSGDGGSVEIPFWWSLVVRLGGPSWVGAETRARPSFWTMIRRMTKMNLHLSDGNMRTRLNVNADVRTWPSVNLGTEKEGENYQGNIFRKVVGGTQGWQYVNLDAGCSGAPNGRYGRSIEVTSCHKKDQHSKDPILEDPMVEDNESEENDIDEAGDDHQDVPKDDHQDMPADGDGEKKDNPDVLDHVVIMARKLQIVENKLTQQEEFSLLMIEKM
uniref:Uncharacterized protein n=1 Tax=Cannabis sativa TaxID=3483 RepID=A0A803PSZ5_CANSA